MADIAKFVEEIKSMTVLELNELVKAIEEEFLSLIHISSPRDRG